MKVKEEPRKNTEENGAMHSISRAPKSIMVRKSALRPRNEGPSSSSRQYLTRKYMWKTKSRLGIPKKKKFVKIRQNSYFSTISRKLR
eukprot:CAMPEP_0114123008 /NCGR_PEP_ID=MMETSP0043_2-20121206/7995_1 /TAXON_ID=464988 /ORGANISM="Hemiselmis andersenii, Strain CCMP644" /LENGTH=86 /DNA_ID=CAMNT_0001215753 /DNA_START=263 /DNA_END=523 /DNA_ORIENTATION=-